MGHASAPRWIWAGVVVTGLLAVLGAEVWFAARTTSGQPRRLTPEERIAREAGQPGAPAMKPKRPTAPWHIYLGLAGSPTSTPFCYFEIAEKKLRLAATRESLGEAAWVRGTDLTVVPTSVAGGQHGTPATRETS